MAARPAAATSASAAFMAGFTELWHRARIGIAPFRSSRPAGRYVLTQASSWLTDPFELTRYANSPSVAFVSAMPIVSSGSAGSQLRRMRTDVDISPLAASALSIAARDGNPQITARLNCTMPSRSPASATSGTRSRPPGWPGAPRRCGTKWCVPDDAVSRTVSPACAPRRSADTSPMTSVSGVRYCATSLPIVRATTSWGSTVVPIG